MDASEVKLYLSLPDGTSKIINLQEYGIKMIPILNGEEGDSDSPKIGAETWRIYIEGVFASNSVILTNSNNQMFAALSFPTTTNSKKENKTKKGDTK